MFSSSIPVMSGTGKQGRRTSSFTLDDISDPVSSGLTFEKDVPPPISEEEEELRAQLKAIDEARRIAEAESRDFYVR
jgi:hypothetical protein